MNIKKNIERSEIETHAPIERGIQMNEKIIASKIDGKINGMKYNAEPISFTRHIEQVMDVTRDDDTADIKNGIRHPYIYEVFQSILV